MISYLQIENVTKSFGDLVLLDNISFHLIKDKKIALIAPNGTGKSTLFNIISGKDAPDAGQIKFHKDITISFLEQDPVLDESKTLLDQVLSLSGELVNVIREYEAAVHTHDEKRIQKAMEQMDFHHAWDYEFKVKEVLSRLKLTDFDKKVSMLSGGERKRVALANALINKSDLLILDEPTNHLDLEMIEWLEEHLRNNVSTLLIVTHDRYFLDRVCNEIVELDNKKLHHYNGNYSYYLEKRSDRILNEQANIDKARNLMRKELDWIRRQPQARGTKAKYRVDAFYDLKEKASQQRIEKSVNINVQTARLGTKIIEIHGLSKRYGNQVLLDDFSYLFGRNEKIGIVGNNGTGKSTLLNMICGNIKADSGTIETGDTVRFGYYRQEGIKFNEQHRVIDIVQEIAEVVSLSNGEKVPVSFLLNQFLFTPEMQYSYVYKLSWGEKRRLYLMTVLIQNPNFLILDEPTNDLDIATLNVLEDYLTSFPGCVVIVSHDRFFMDKVVDHVFVFQGEGVIKDFPGNYSDYRDYIIDKEKNEAKPVKAEKKEEEAKPVRTDQAKKVSFKDKREYEQLTAEIDTLEKEKKEIETALASGKLKNDELLEKSHRMGEVIDLLNRKTDRWIELSDLIGS